MAPTYFIRNSAQVSELLLLCPELLVESVLRLATVLDSESPPRLESTDLLLVLISLLWELLLLVALFAFPKHLPSQLAPRAPCRSYSTVFKGSTDSSPQRSLPFTLTRSALDRKTAYLCAVRAQASDTHRPGSRRSCGGSSGSPHSILELHQSITQACSYSIQQLVYWAHIMSQVLWLSVSPRSTIIPWAP